MVPTFQHRTDPMHTDHPRPGGRSGMCFCAMGFDPRVVERTENQLQHVQRPCRDRRRQTGIPCRVSPTALHHTRIRVL